jgi:hypothetical protein
MWQQCPTAPAALGILHQAYAFIGVKRRTTKVFQSAKTSHVQQSAHPLQVIPGLNIQEVGYHPQWCPASWN